MGQRFDDELGARVFVGRHPIDEPLHGFLVGTRRGSRGVRQKRWAREPEGYPPSNQTDAQTNQNGW